MGLKVEPRKGPIAASRWPAHCGMIRRARIPSGVTRAKARRGRRHSGAALATSGAGRGEVTAVRLLLWKVRLSVLWVALAVGMSAHMLLVIAEPGTVEELMEGRVEDVEITTGFLIFAAVFWVVPLLMAFLALVLHDRANRFANAGVGLVVTAMWAWDLVAHSVSDGFSGLGLAMTGMVAAGLAILWHAWRWPKVEDELLLADEVTPIAAGTV